jgi:hypothetical protein
LSHRDSSDGRSRRISPVAAHPDDRLLSEPTAGTQPCRREPLFMPLSGRSLTSPGFGRGRWKADLQLQSVACLRGKPAAHAPRCRRPAGTHLHCRAPSSGSGSGVRRTSCRHDERHTGNWQARGHRRQGWRHDRAAHRLMTRAVAIGDCHGQELNRRNLHDPALSPAQVEPRPRGLAVVRRQTKGLENGIPDWKSVSLVRRARKYPRAPHASLPRRRSHASRHRPHANGISLPAHVGPGKRARCGRRRSSETADRTP